MRYVPMVLAGLVFLFFSISQPIAGSPGCISPSSERFAEIISREFVLEQIEQLSGSAKLKIVPPEKDHPNDYVFAAAKQGGESDAYIVSLSFGAAVSGNDPAPDSSEAASRVAGTGTNCPVQITDLTSSAGPGGSFRGVTFLTEDAFFQVEISIFEDGNWDGEALDLDRLATEIARKYCAEFCKD